MAKSPSYTKKGPGRYHNNAPSDRTKESKELRGNKASRKVLRGHMGKCNP